MSSVNPDSDLATFKVILRPLVVWIWIGGLVLLLGTLVAVVPSIKELLGEATARTRAPARATASTAVLLLALAAGSMLLVRASVARAQDEGSSSAHAANITIHDARERQVFERLLCMCGDCQRLPLSTCGCSEADATRAGLRQRLARGDSIAAIVDAYREEFGAKAIAIPADSGLDRALWAVPIGAIVVAMGGILWLGWRWSKRAAVPAAPAAALTVEAAQARAKGDAEYDRKLEDELRNLEDR